MSGLEDGIPGIVDTTGPRADIVLGAGELESVHASLWMGGARSLHGIALEAPNLSRSVIVDCAGEMPRWSTRAAAAWHACVFVDHDGPIASMHRLEEVAHTVAGAMRGDGPASIEAVYVMCTHGMNRSGLMTGLILQELGLAGPEAVSRIVAARRGALSNLWFRDILIGTRAR